MQVLCLCHILPHLPNRYNFPCRFETSCDPEHRPQETAPRTPNSNPSPLKSSCASLLLEAPLPPNSNPQTLPAVGSGKMAKQLACEACGRSQSPVLFAGMWTCHAVLPRLLLGSVCSRQLTVKPVQASVRCFMRSCTLCALYREPKCSTPSACRCKHEIA